MLNWNKGYATDWFNSVLRPEGARRLVDMGCSGETTTTFINGGCRFVIHKVRYSNKLGQLHAALDFIRAHPGQVSPVTIDIGADDVLAGIDPSTCAVTDTQTISTIAQTFNTNYTSILNQLKQALTVNGATTGDLFTMNYYNPYQNQCAGNPDVFNLFTQFNDDIARDAQQVGVPMADVFTAFGGAGDPSNHNINPNITGTPDGQCPADTMWPTPQAYTWICTAPNPVLGSAPSIHPTTLGYQQIETAFQTLAGY